MRNINWNRYDYSINIDFFKEWSSQMAYILGFTCADGNIHGISLGWDLTNKQPSNKDLLKKINEAMNSTYEIENREESWRLRIHNKIIAEDIKKLGITPNKKKVLEFPKVPEEYMSHFIRGFLDGDGWVGIRFREDRGIHEASVGFSNGSKSFMNSLAETVKERGIVDNVNLRKRKEKKKSGKISITYQMEFYSDNAYNLLKFLYDDMNSDDIFLKRKYEKQLKARKILERKRRKKNRPRLWNSIEERIGMSVKEFLHIKINKDGKLPKEVAKELDVSLSSIYRWMDKTGIRELTERGSDKWTRRMLDGRKKGEA